MLTYCTQQVSQRAGLSSWRVRHLSRIATTYRYLIIQSLSPISPIRVNHLKLTAAAQLLTVNLNLKPSTVIIIDLSHIFFITDHALQSVPKPLDLELCPPRLSCGSEKVTQKNGSVAEVAGKKFLVCTGAGPSRVSIKGLNTVKFVQLLLSQSMTSLQPFSFRVFSSQP